MRAVGSAKVDSRQLRVRKLDAAGVVNALTISPEFPAIAQHSKPLVRTETNVGPGGVHRVGLVRTLFSVISYE